MKGPFLLSVCASHFFLHYSCHHITRLYVKGQDHRGQNKFYSYMGNVRNLTSVSIHKWLHNYAQRFKMHKRGETFFSRSSIKFQGHQQFDQNGALSNFNSSLSSQMATKWHTQLLGAWKCCPIAFRSPLWNGHMGRKNDKLALIFAFSWW